MRPLFAAAVLCACVLLVGCKGEERAADLPLKDVPEPVMKTAKEKLLTRWPDLKIDQAWKTPKGNYEVRGKTKDGKTHDVQITPGGEFVEFD